MIEARARKLIDERRRVADKDDGQAIRMQIFARDALHVVHRHGIDALAICLQLVQVQAVENRVQHLERDLAGCLDGQRKRAGQILLRPLELALVDAIANQPPELVHHQPQRLAGCLRTRVRLGNDVAGLLQAVHVGRRAVREAALGAKHAMQPVGPFPAEHFDGEVQRHVVAVLARDADVADADLGLHGPRPIDDDETPCWRRRLGRLRRFGSSASPRAKRTLGAREGFVRRDVADDREDRVVGAEPFLVERQQILAADRGNRARRAGLRLAVRMEPVHEPIEDHVGQVLWIVVADPQARKQLLALPLDFLFRKRRMLRQLRHQVESNVQAVLHDDGLNEAQVGARARSQRPADGINRVGDLLRRPARGPLIQQRGREGRDAGPILGILSGAGAHEQAQAHRRLLVMRDRDHLETVRERTNRIRRELDVVRLERMRRSFRGPVLRLGRDRQPPGSTVAASSRAARVIAAPPAADRSPWA